MITKQILLLSVMICPALFAQAEKLELLHADELRGDQIGGQAVQMLIGNVQFRQGDALLNCDRATRYIDIRETLLEGRVQLTERSQKMNADQIYYYEDTEIMRAQGKVMLQDSSNIMRANLMQYFRREERGRATGSVSLVDSTQRMKLTGNVADYDQRRGYAKIMGNPVFTMADSSNDKELVITGNVIEMFSDGDTIRVIEKVKITREEITAFCEMLQYVRKANRIHLSVQPVAQQQDNFLAGKEIELGLVDTEVSSISIFGEAVIVTKIDSTVRTDLPFDILTGEKVWVGVTKEVIDSVRVFGRATSYYHVIEDGAEKGLNKVLGDEMVLVFQDGELDQVRVKSKPGASDGAFYPPKDKGMVQQELIFLLEKLQQHPSQLKQFLTTGR